MKIKKRNFKELLYPSVTNTPSPLRGTSPILGEELFMLVYNELGMLNSSPPGAGGVARSAEGVEIIFKVQGYGNAGRRYDIIESDLKVIPLSRVATAPLH